MRAKLPALWATPIVAPCSFGGVRIEINPNTGGRVRLDPIESSANTSSKSNQFPLMNGINARLTPARNRLTAISLGSPIFFTSRPIAPPCTNAPMIPQ